MREGAQGRDVPVLDVDHGERREGWHGRQVVQARHDAELERRDARELVAGHPGAREAAVFCVHGHARRAQDARLDLDVQMAEVDPGVAAGAGIPHHGGRLADRSFADWAGRRLATGGGLSARGRRPRCRPRAAADQEEQRREPPHARSYAAPPVHLPRHGARRPLTSVRTPMPGRGSSPRPTPWRETSRRRLMRVHASERLFHDHGARASRPRAGPDRPVGVRWRGPGRRGSRPR